MSGTEKITFRDRLGFIGLGFLGSRIARRLLTAGFPAVAYDIDDARVAELAERGADTGWTPDRLARDVDVVLSCLPADLAAETVYLGGGGVFRSDRPGTRIIELSTISAGTSRRLHGLARQSGLSMLDVAISGSTPAAEAGALTLFGGGEREVFESAESIFSAIAGQWFYMGPGGPAWL